MPNGYGLYPNMIEENGTLIRILNFPEDNDAEVDPVVAIRLLRELADRIENKMKEIQARNAEHAQKYEMAIKQLTDHITRSDDGTFILDVEASDIGIDSNVFEDLKASMEITNDLIRQGLIKPTEIKIEQKAGKQMTTVEHYTLNIERDASGLWFVTGSMHKGLVVTGHTLGEALSRVEGVWIDLLQAEEDLKEEAKNAG